MVSSVNHLPSNNGSLAPRLLYRLHFLPLHVLFVLHVHWVVRGATVTFLSNFVFLTHPLISEFKIIVLLLHKFPPLYISLHLGDSASFNQALFLNFLLMALLSVVGGEVLLEAIYGSDEVRGCWVWVVQLGVVHELMIPSNVLPRSHLVQKLLIYIRIQGGVGVRSRSQL